MPKKFRHAIVGGTFDHFHIGHRALLDKAFAIAERVSIGLSKPELYAHKEHSQSIEDYTLREAAVKTYLKQKNRESRATLIPITDMYGTTLTDGSIDVIVVSPDTEANAKLINQKRHESNFLEMEILTVPFVLADDGEPVSSARIREGKINAQGQSYLTFFESNPSYTLPDSLRDELKKPHGDIVTSVEELTQHITHDTVIITVGDIVSSTLLNSEYKPTIAIIDLQTRRHDLEKNIADLFAKLPISLNNPAGTITKDFAPLFLRSLLSDNSVIRVDGEEDLLALPAILLAPLNAVVIYGQHDLGMVIVKVTEEKKEYIKTLLTRFDLK